MPGIRVSDPRAPFGDAMRAALAYPFRGAALAALVALTLAHYLALLPPPVGFGLELLVWAATYRYALACLRHSADGYADPPELAEDDAAGWTVVGVMLGGSVLAVACGQLFSAGAGLLASLLLAIALPAIVISLAFGDGAGHALNPLAWVQAMARFGVPYFLLVAVQSMVAWVQGAMHRGMDAWLPAILSFPLFYFVATAATLFNFHLMGVLIHRHHEQLGLVPEASRLARASGQDADDDCLREVQRLQAAGDALRAISLLGERLDERAAPASLHLACRTLLRDRGRHAEMLARSSRCIDALLAEKDETRALAVVTENLAIDEAWLPDGPEATGKLAYAAMHRGMTRLALKLARAYPNTWPQEPMAPHFGLMAARLLVRLGRHAEAGVLASKLVQAWPDCVERSEIEQFLATLPLQGVPP